MLRSILSVRPIIEKLSTITPPSPSPVRLRARLIAVPASLIVAESRFPRIAKIKKTEHNSRQLTNLESKAPKTAPEAIPKPSDAKRLLASASVTSNATVNP